jgi:UDP-N-acetylmuramoyl-L-alanyl-D-glutamate--2,6-diaminopimelate ligase
MNFDELLAVAASRDGPQVRIDSRLVKAGDVFVAIPGSTQDGGDFIGDAVAHGAKYIVCGDGRPARASDEGCRFVRVANPAHAAGLLAQAAKGNPAAKLINLAVTGTNGKTTVTYLVRSCIRAAGKRCGLIGTIVYDTGLTCSPAPLTTPDCLSLADAQREMVEAGAGYMVIEASSHALYQDRLAGIKFKAAAFTNLTGDHLDFHKTKEAYLAAKMKLFAELSAEAVAVLNKQSTEAKSISSQTKAHILWYAVDEPADITAHIESMDIEGTVLIIEYLGRKQRVATPLLGRHNASNHLAAAGLCLAAGLDLETIAGGLSALQGVPGRLEKVGYSEVRDRGSGVRNRIASDERRATSHVLVDYAHTDDALKNVLSTLKPLCRGRLIVVFGCGGDRDRTKRPRMAKVAEQFADIVIVTSDNPRTEQPMDIIEQIVAGFETGHPTGDGGLRDTKYEIRNTKTIEPDRKRAIELAISIAVEDDIVLIAGKGHETYQIIGTKKFDFSDREVAEQCLRSTTVPVARGSRDRASMQH